jgi:hypothetical protein
MRFRLVIFAVLAVSSTALAQKAYQTPEEASSALVGALQPRDQNALKVVLGADYRTILPLDNITQGDVDTFLASYQKAHQLQPSGPDQMVIAVGDQGWTFPVPIVKGKQGWSFDTKAGRAEMTRRRIGRDELDVPNALLAYCDAQKEYASADRNSDGVPEYAQKLISTPGKHDGLYWPAQAGETESPLGPLLANHEPGTAYLGYRYKILDAQGPDAPGGERSFIDASGHMTNGFALVAWPEAYGETGVMTFIVSHDGMVYEHDFGPNTATIVSKMNEYNPDQAWTKLP